MDIAACFWYDWQHKCTWKFELIWVKEGHRYCLLPLSLYYIQSDRMKGDFTWFSCFSVLLDLWIKHRQTWNGLRHGWWQLGWGSCLQTGIQMVCFIPSNHPRMRRKPETVFSGVSFTEPNTARCQCWQQ